ncbi:chaperonin 10-like protein [Exophiala viscosa]|uniref:chaperonin 10-like protein n=1 Tax=Exophiala viscosa TaxID=2486360 RepID=UPI0021A1A2BE|nr:chaperonin 10-like protein [Exophiala viscosa]
MAQDKTMKAVRWHPDTKKVQVDNVPIPKPDNDLMLVRTIGSGLCHSEMLVLHGTYQLPQPTTLGHEAVGEVVELGSDVSGFKVGDKVGFLNGLRSCWKCDGCKVHYGFCRSEKFTMQGFSAADGFLAEYCLVDPNAAFNLPDGIDIVKFAPLCCAGITAYNGVKKADLKPGQWLAVIGCGGLGQLALRYAKALDLNVIGIDVNDEVLATAKKAGIEHTINSRSTPDVAGEIQKIAGSLADAVVVYTAVKAGFDLAPKLIKIGARFVAVGCPPGEISFNPVELALGRYSLQGANNHGTPKQLRECADFTTANKIECPVQLFKIDEIGDMIDMMEEGRMAGKRLVVDFS